MRTHETFLTLIDGPEGDFLENVKAIAQTVW